MKVILSNNLSMNWNMHPGKFCNTALGNLTMANCHAGFVCVEGSFSPEPVASTQGLIYILLEGQKYFTRGMIVLDEPSSFDIFLVDPLEL